MRPVLYFLLFLIPNLTEGASSSTTFSSNIEESFARARQKKKPLIISFFGIWCPPCNELEEVVFESSQFLGVSKNFELLKVDADAPSSWELKNRFRVGGYPTVVFTTYDGREIYRIIGLRKPHEFARTMSWVFDNREIDLEKACKGTSTASIWHCAFTCSEKEDESCTAKSFAKLDKRLKPADPRVQFIETYRSKKLQMPAERIKAYEKLLAAHPKSPFIYLWASEWAELVKETKTKEQMKTVLAPVINEYQNVATHRKLDLTGLVPSDVAQIRADLLEKMGDVDQSKQAWKEADNMLLSLAKKLPVGSAGRGYTLERIGCLSSAGDLESALKLSNEYRQKFSQEFTFHYRSGLLLKKMGDRTEAIAALKEAYKHSYGDNRVRTATQLIELYGEKKSEIDQAKQIYDEVKTQIRPDAALDVRTHRYIKLMDEAIEKVKG